MAPKLKHRFKIKGLRMLAAENGVTAIEYALLLPILLVLVFGIIDAGRVIWTQATLDHAAEAAARCGAVDAVKCGTPEAIKAYAIERAAGLVLQPSAFTVSAAACGNKVSAALPVSLTLPWSGSYNITVKATACYPL